MTDDLFRPTVGEGRSADLPMPWRPGSQLWVAFFGGAFALLAIAWLNTWRLGMDWRVTGRRLVGMTVVGYVVATVAVAGMMAAWGADPDTQRLSRWTYRGMALLLFVAFSRVQEPARRRYEELHDEAYASMWRAGLVAVIVGGLAQGALSAAVLVPLLIGLGNGP